MSDNNLRMERMPTNWCAGCLLTAILIQTASVTKKLGMNKTNTVAISGIGCTARGTGYLDFDGVNGLHGRAIPIAEGIKLASPETNVFILSGDGDLTGIGGNHLMHAARRNLNITILCAVNETYGMTGGQMAPTTPKGTKTLTSPEGSEFNKLNVQGIITSNKNYFFARTSTAQQVHMVKCIEEAFKHKGFSFVEIYTPCFTNHGRRLKFKSFKGMLDDIKERYPISEGKELGNNEMGITRK